MCEISMYEYKAFNEKLRDTVVALFLSARADKETRAILEEHGLGELLDAIVGIEVEGDNLIVVLSKKINLGRFWLPSGQFSRLEFCFRLVPPAIAAEQPQALAPRAGGK